MSPKARKPERVSKSSCRTEKQPYQPPKIESIKLTREAAEALT